MAASGTNVGGGTQATRFEPLPRAPGARVPLSPAQRRLWSSQRTRPDQALAPLSACFHLVGPLEPAALRSALDAVVARHEVLRTRIEVAADGEPAQLVDPPGPVGLVVTDLSAAPAMARDDRARRLAAASIAEPFDLTTRWPIRAHLIRLAERRHLLVLVLHALMADDRSLGVLYRDLAACYAAALDGRPPDLPALPIQYPDFALWSARRQEAGALRAIDAPARRQLGVRASHAAAVVPLTVSARVATAVRALAVRAGTTPFTTLLAAFATLLHRYGAGAEVVVGTPVSGRGDARLEHLIGPFADIRALRVRLGGEPDFHTVLRRVRGAVTEPLGDRPVRATFQLNPWDHNELWLPGLTGTRLWLGRPVSRFELSLHLNETLAGFRGWLTYATDLVDHPTAERIARHYTALLANLVAAPDVPVGRAEFLRPAERELPAPFGPGPAEPPAARAA